IVGLPEFSADGTRLALEDLNGNLRVYEVTTADLLAAIAVSRMPPGYFPNFRFSPNGSTLAAVDADCKSVTLWDSATGTTKARLAEASGPLEFSPDGATLATGWGRDVQLWDVSSGQQKASFKG